MEKMNAEPLFDSTRSALRFALNHSVSVKPPQMVRMMAWQTKLKSLELGDGTRIVVSMPKGRPKDAQLKSMDGAGTAGFILRHLATLPDPQQMILIAKSVIPNLPCACRSPCCAGFKPNPTWQRPVERLCHHLMVDAELTKIKGKKGLSTGPMLRSALVGKYLVVTNEMTLVEIAQRCDISEQTVMNHKRPIFEYLAKHEDEGWSSLDVLLSESGIVGFLA